MAIGEFQNGWELRNIRQNYLNKAIKTVDELDPKVAGLQTVVALTMTHPTVDIPGKRIVFRRGGAGDPQYLELGPMMDTMKHGVDISNAGGKRFTDVTKIKLMNAELSQNGDTIEVDVKPVEGQVNAGATRKLSYIRVTGNTSGSSMDDTGLMTLNIPAYKEISAQVKGGFEFPISKIHIVGHADHSTVTNDTLSIDIPDPVKGNIVGGDSKQLSDIVVVGNTGTSNVNNSGVMTIDLPQQEADYDGTGYEAYHKIKIEGNKGNTRVEGQVLHIDLPAGGGGGGVADLKVGTDSTTPVPNVGEIYFKDSEIKVDQTTRSGNKVLISHKGTPVEVDTKFTGVKSVKQIKITGDVTGTDVSDTGLLTLDIPKHAGLEVSDGTDKVEHVEAVQFEGAKVKVDATSANKAVVTIENVKGKMGTTEGSVTELEITGSLGASTFSGGKMKIELPAGGGGTGGADITGVVGSTSAKIERIEVAGNMDGSSVTESTKTLKINVPKKATIRGGLTDVDDVDIVEIAQSVVEGFVETDGRKRALISPQVVMFFNGWYPSLDALNDDVKEPKRIPTKSTAYVTNPLTKQDELVMWMPDLTGGGGLPSWKVVRNVAALSLMDNNTPTAPVLSVKKNLMTEVDPQGVLTIKDTTIPDMPLDIVDKDGSTIVQKGLVSNIQIHDGKAIVDYNSNNKELIIHRAQRRMGLGMDPTGAHPEFGDPDYEGSLFFNTDDKAWWGYYDTAGVTGQKKWSKVIHGGMSDQVASLSARLQESLPQVRNVDSNGDNLLWKYSGWTGVPKDAAAILPPLAVGQTGMVIQTFMGPTSSGIPDETGRIQIGYLGADASMYKRYRDKTLNKWSDWVKMSFNPGDLAEHNKDPHAHAVTHPFYKTVTFDCTYKELKSAGYYMPNIRMHYLGSSNGIHRVNDDMITNIPYAGKYRIRGHIYFSGITATPSAQDYGTWHIYLYKRKKGESTFAEAYHAVYQHNTTSMVYPPLRWDAQDITLAEGDDIRLGFRFDPNSGNEAAWLAIHPDIGFYGLRSFISIDVQGNDGGFSLGETHRKIHGRFAAIDNAGLKVFYDKDQRRNRTVDETIATNVTEMQP